MNDEDKHTLVIQPLYRAYQKTYSEQCILNYSFIDFLVDCVQILSWYDTCDKIEYSNTHYIPYDKAIDMMEKEIVFRKLQL
jgi:hypothetical protein